MNAGGASCIEGAMQSSHLTCNLLQSIGTICAIRIGYCPNSMANKIDYANCVIELASARQPRYDRASTKRSQSP